MQSKKISLAVVLCLAITAAETWRVDEAKAKILFVVKGPFGMVHGSLDGLKATIQFDEKNPSACSISASVDPNTINTGIGMRNKDLRNEEIWFNTKKYPEISFRSSKVEKTEKGFNLAGNLTVKGVSKPVEIPFTFSNSGAGGVFKGEFIIHREDFNLGKKGGVVGSAVTISLEVPVTR